MHCRRLARPVCPEREDGGAIWAAGHPASPGRRAERAPCRPPAPDHGRPGARPPGPGNRPALSSPPLPLAPRRPATRPEPTSGGPAVPSSPLFLERKKPGGRPPTPGKHPALSSPPSPGTPAARHPASRRERGTAYPVVAAVPGAQEARQPTGITGEAPRFVLAVPPPRHPGGPPPGRSPRVGDQPSRRRRCSWTARGRRPTADTGEAPRFVVAVSLAPKGPVARQAGVSGAPAVPLLLLIAGTAGTPAPGGGE